MILKIGDWIFDVDMTATMEYSAREAADHCDCADCRNFYAAIDAHYPQLRPFLAQFGLDVEAPDRMSPLVLDGAMLDYDPEYYVFGRILRSGSRDMTAGLAGICVPQWEGEVEGRPAFALNVYGVTLPWVLSEPFQQ